jgi:hypothetical protein
MTINSIYEIGKNSSLLHLFPERLLKCVMRVPFRLSFLLLLLIAAALPSCKSPTATTPAGPTLTLILPDSTGFDELVSMSVTSSQPFPANAIFVWNFGDSVVDTTAVPSATHTYVVSNAYKVVVQLMDSMHRQSIASASSSITVGTGPTITMNAPDTVSFGAAFDVQAAASTWRTPGWAFQWSWGDSSSTFARDSAEHAYLNPGTYSVRVSLMDTIAHRSLASASALVHVVARHFNLALLQSMTVVDYTFRAFGDTIIQGNTSNSCGGPGYVSNRIGPLVWSNNGYTISAHTSYRDSTPGFQEPAFGSENIFESGTFDPAFTQLTSFLQGEYDTNFSGQDQPGNFFCYSTYQSSLSINRVPFISSSDSDVVFEAYGMISQNGTYQSTIYGRSIGGELTIQYKGSWVSANPTFTPYIRIRFHK